MFARTLALALSLIPAAVPAIAQDSTQRVRSPRPLAPETALRLRQELELTEEQIAQLNALRQEALAARQAHHAAMMELRSRLDAGEITPEEFRTEMSARREALPDTPIGRDDRVADVLTDTQRQRVDELRRQAFRGRMGPAGGRGRGAPGAGRGWHRGFAPGPMGPGRGPGWRGAPSPDVGPRWHRRGGWDMRRGWR